MKLLFIFGAHAAGKMTVGQAVSRLTPMKLFHNHMTIEPVIDLFGCYNGAVTERLRQVVFEEFVKTDNYGLIFTFIWAFEEPHDEEYVRWLSKLYEDAGAQVDYVELIAPQEVRLERNRTENRLREKPSKRDVALSEMRFLSSESRHRCVSEPGEVERRLGLAPGRYLRIENENLDPETVAEMIAAHFGYERRDGNAV
ncbi:MAG: shikimate kinase [Clostridiales bacterium]|nr:shikimate kinase [Clostridiales bacterium]